MKLNNNDDSHNSGLNLLIYNMLLDIESHPAWVCGLKHKKNAALGLFSKSHPAWVCGLKHKCVHAIKSSSQSHPAWVCGLKHICYYLHNFLFTVTPCVGVWIETYEEHYDRTSKGGHTLRGCVD